MDENRKPRPYLIIGFLAIVAAAGALKGYLFLNEFMKNLPDCSESSEAVQFARGLPPERLAQLYADMERLSTDESVPLGGYTKYSEGADQMFPDPFTDIRATKISPREASIMLEGCFDNYVDLTFQGFAQNRDQEPDREITLIWLGENGEPESEILWSATTGEWPRP